MLIVRRSCVFILSLSLVLFFSLCTISKASESEAVKSKVSSTLAEGTWIVEGTAKITFTYKFNKKTHHRTVVLNTAETWTFNSDGTFTAQGNDGLSANGTWRENGKNVTVSFNKAEYQTIMEDLLAADGYPATITITKLTAKGTVGASTIRGKLTANARFSITEFGISVNGTVTSTTTFAGAKSSLAPTADQEDVSLATGITKMIEESVNNQEE